MLEAGGPAEERNGGLPPDVDLSRLCWNESLFSCVHSVLQNPEMTHTYEPDGPQQQDLK